MRLLLDTHVVLWWLSDDARLGAEARAAIADAETDVAVSAASAWEIAIKKRRGELEAPDDLAAQLERHGFEALAITVAHALRSGELEPLHDDPFDRLLVAQGQIEGLTIVTGDRLIERYGVPVLRA